MARPITCNCDLRTCSKCRIRIDVAKSRERKKKRERMKRLENARAVLVGHIIGSHHAAPIF